MRERCQQARRAGIEALLLEDGAGGDDAHHLALEELLPLAGLALLADRDRVPGAEKPRHVRLGRVRRESAQRHLVRRAAIARRERQIEHARRDARVVEEHLVEVAEPEEEDRALVLRLDAQVLCEEGAPHTRLRFFAM